MNRHLQVFALACSLLFLVKNKLTSLIIVAQVKSFIQPSYHSHVCVGLECTSSGAVYIFILYLGIEKEIVKIPVRLCVPFWEIYFHISTTKCGETSGMYR